MTKSEKEKIKTRNKLIIGIILIFVMIISVLGFGFMNTDSETRKEIVYNGFEFKEQNGLWVLNTQGVSFAFKYNPEEVQKIDSEVKDISSYYRKPLYIDSKNNEAKIEIYRNFNNIAQRVQDACFSEKKNECINENLPIKNCDDNLIIIKKADYSEIKQKDGCVFIYAPDEDLGRVTDEFLFKVIGIE